MNMKRALIVTVGTGTRPDVYIVKPLVKTIKDSRPDYLVLIVTEVSFSFGEAIAKELGLKDNSFSIEILKDFDDFQAVFRSINMVFDKLTTMGFSNDEIQLDFTSGTKAMSSGAVLSAIYNHCASIKYITGQRKNGVVVDDTEKFITVCPSTVFSLHDIQLAQEMMFRLRFDTANDIFGSLRIDLLNDEERRLVKNFHLASQAYLAWDIFDHTTAFKKMEKVDWNIPALSPFKPSLESMDLLECPKGSSEEKKENLLLLDLFNNAVRRGEEGKYDDAVARLYRSTELFAQQLLAHEHFKIDTGNIDLTKIPNHFHGIMERHRNDIDGKIRIGMEMDFKLLNELGHPAGKAFLDDMHLRGQLSERNGSILAHGLKPVHRSLYRKIRRALLSLFEIDQPDFSDNAGSVQFPWIKDAF